MKKTLLVLTLLFFLSLNAFSQNKSEATLVYEKTLPAVVLITTDQALGSGVILRTDGIIATNFHVINGASSASVKLSNGDIYDDVSVLDTDERKDIAILKIKATNLPVIETANSDDVQIGGTVYTIGAPKGLSGSLSAGIVSALRSISEFDPRESGFRVIQFTAPISPGSSGGALLDSSGRLIGLPFAFRVETQNVNLAIPANYVTPLALNAKGEGHALQKLSLAIGKPASTLDELAGTYTGVWTSDKYSASGALVMTITVESGLLRAVVSLTGSDMFRQDTLIVKLQAIGTAWRMDYKSMNGKISGSGIFRGGTFRGDYNFSKFIWRDNGQWVADK
jgi:S1-C subfamily serine protease